ncbi:MAG: hypothetical protein AAGG75_17470 [Bacteroidota bacterium]
MKTIRLPIAILSALLLLALPGWTQEENARSSSEDYYDKNFFQLNGGMTLGIPTGNFDVPGVDASLGWNASALIRITRSFPVYAGLEVGNFIYDRERLDFGDLELETRPAVFQMHGMLRIAPPTNFFIRPYVDGMAGFKSLHLKTKFFDPQSEDNSAFESETENRDNAFSFGIALGLEIPIFHADDASHLSLDLRCSYFKGGSAEYFVRRDDAAILNPNDPIEVYEPTNSTTDLIMPHIGLTFNFGRGQMD